MSLSFPITAERGGISSLSSLPQDRLFSDAGDAEGAGSRAAQLSGRRRRPRRRACSPALEIAIAINTRRPHHRVRTLVAPPEQEAANPFTTARLSAGAPATKMARSTPPIDHKLKSRLASQNPHIAQARSSRLAASARDGGTLERPGESRREGARRPGRRR